MQVCQFFHAVVVSTPKTNCLIPHKSKALEVKIQNLVRAIINEQMYFFSLRFFFKFTKHNSFSLMFVLIQTCYKDFNVCFKGPVHAVLMTFTVQLSKLRSNDWGFVSVHKCEIVWLITANCPHIMHKITVIHMQFMNLDVPGATLDTTPNYWSVFRL